MIDAKEARRKTILATKLKKTMEEIDKEINRAIESGYYDASVSIWGDLDSNLLDALTKELDDLGYAVKYEPTKPCPAGCPSDQWGYDMYSYLKISWKEE